MNFYLQRYMGLEYCGMGIKGLIMVEEMKNEGILINKIMNETVILH